MMAPGADPITPVAQSKGLKWRVGKLVEDQIGISGGVGGTKPISTKIMKLPMDGAIWRFVQLDKNAEWFLRGVGGSGTAKGMLKAVEVLLYIRDKFNGGDADGSEETAVAANSAVAGGDADGDDVDPMDELDVAVGTPTKQTVATKTIMRGSSRIKTLEMPERPPCSTTDTSTVTIAVYQDSKTPKQSNLWIRLDCIHWLLS